MIKPERGERGIRYIPGVEIDCTLNRSNFHVLGYGMLPGPDFEANKIKKDAP